MIGYIPFSGIAFSHTPLLRQHALDDRVFPGWFPSRYPVSQSYDLSRLRRTVSYPVH